MTNAVDLFTTYQFIKKLVTPFEKWKAYHLGIIDSQGHQLRTRDEFKTSAERDAFGYLDLLALNLRKILAKVPGGNKTFATYAAALLLLKEYPKVHAEDMELIDNLETIYEGYLTEAELLEDGPTNAVGTGAIAGAGVGPKGEPPVSSKSRYKKKNQQDSDAMLAAVNAILLKRNQP